MIISVVEMPELPKFETRDKVLFAASWTEIMTL